MLQDLWPWYNCGLSETTLVISSSQSELNRPRKFRLRDFFLSLLYSLLLDMLTLTQLLTSPLPAGLSSTWLDSTVLDLEKREENMTASCEGVTSCPADGPGTTDSSERGHHSSGRTSQSVRSGRVKSKQWFTVVRSARLSSYSSGGAERGGGGGGRK